MEVIRRGEIWLARLDPAKGAEVGKIRPVVIVQQDEITATGLGTILVAPLTTQFRPAFAPLRIRVPARDRLLRDCYVMGEHLRAVDRSRVVDGPLAVLTDSELTALEGCMRAVLGIL